MSDNEKEVRPVNPEGTTLDGRQTSVPPAAEQPVTTDPNQAVEGSVAAEPETLMWMVFEYTLGGSQPVVWNMKTREDAWECCPRDGRHFVARVLADSKEKG